MFKVIIKSMTSEPLWLFFLVLYLSEVALGVGLMNGSAAITVVAIEGSSVILNCSHSTDIVQQLFDWKKDGQMEVFMYDAGVHYNNGRAGQDQQFRGRVSHFPEQLKYGNASILIRNIKEEDSGEYTCHFPRLEPTAQIFHINLKIERKWKNRLDESIVAIPKPYVEIFDVTKYGVVLHCEAQSASPHLTLQWQDGDGSILLAEEPQVSERGDHYNIILKTTVTSTTTNCFHCILKQEEIKHMIDVNITVSEKLFEDKSGLSAGLLIGVWFSGVVSFAAAQAIFKGIKYITEKH